MQHEITYSPVKQICKGRITSKINDSETYEVSIHNSVLGAFNGPIYATASYQPGLDNNYKQGDYVLVMITFMYGSDGKYKDPTPGSANYIMGLYNERAITNIKVENDKTQTGKDRLVIKNKISQAGFVASDSGEVYMSSGAMHILLKAFGFGIYEDMSHTVAQNHFRVIANAPNYLSREHFGMFAGDTMEDKASRVSDSDYYINYRRFVTKTLSPDDWVSTCEGSFSPWVGANNEINYVSASKEVLLSKVINHGDSRITVEMGEPGDSFVNLRIDNVMMCEKGTANGATPAILSNKFNLKVSDKGAVELTSGGAAPIAKFKLTITADGELEIHAAKKITITHGDSDTSINSIVLDPIKGIDVTALNGFRVNGQPLINQRYLDWMVQNQLAMWISSAPGAPAPINPAIAPVFNQGALSPDSAEGFTTKNVGIPAIGLISVVDTFSTV